METTGKSRTLTNEEMEKSANRLSTHHRVEVRLKPLVQHRTLTREAEEHSIKHLYDDSIAHRQYRLEEIERAANAEIDKYHAQCKKLDAEEQDSMVQRLYTESIERKQQSMKELYDRELGFEERQKKKLGKAEQGKVVVRLYNEGMENNRKKHIALFEKYVLERRSPAVQRSRGEVAAASEKLWKGEGVTTA
ncbi:hypothetical protein DQ04_00051030 [Trypanosoma grayi]|uniref:hypothetical protein n=1 Tax=Trypanosoma grayi TaxID=71804 RepID=UPI0004F4AAC1|nr:hypothetical protein DQ04_00051030 [Trypanosoma grayi]KEG15508.1 hypothetical protein DQ04_00051030 [Trypanosoma grayi]